MAEAFVYDHIRTPRGKGKAVGSLHEVKPIDLVVGLLNELKTRNPSLDPGRVDDVVLGVVTPVGDQGADIALHLSLLAPVDGERDVDVAEGLAVLGIPAEAASAVAQVYARHGQEVAAELSEVVRTLVWPPFRDAGGTVEQLRELVHRLKPLTVAGLVTAYEQAIDESVATYDSKRAR